jgi:hypothetical protein
LVAEFLGEFYELFLLLFLGREVGFEGDFFLVGFSAADEAVDDASQGSVRAW